MKDPEDMLKGALLAPPTLALDRRMEALFAAARRSGSPRGIRTRLFLAILLGAGAAASVALRSAKSAAPAFDRAPGLVYHLQAEGDLQRMLLGPPASRPPVFHVMVVARAL